MFEILLIVSLCSAGAGVCACKSLKHGAEVHRARSLRRGDIPGAPGTDRTQLLERSR